MGLAYHNNALGNRLIFTRTYDFKSYSGTTIIVVGLPLTLGNVAPGSPSGRHHAWV